MILVFFLLSWTNPIFKHLSKCINKPTESKKFFPFIIKMKEGSKIIIIDSFNATLSIFYQIVQLVLIIILTNAGG